MHTQKNRLPCRNQSGYISAAQQPADYTSAHRASGALRGGPPPPPTPPPPGPPPPTDPPSIWRTLRSSSSKTNSINSCSGPFLHLAAGGLRTSVCKENDCSNDSRKSNRRSLTVHDTDGCAHRTPVWLPFFRDYLIFTSVVVTTAARYKTGECGHPLFHSRRLLPRGLHTTRAGVALPDTTRRITAGVLRLPGLRICGNAGASHCWRVCLAE